MSVESGVDYDEPGQKSLTFLRGLFDRTKAKYADRQLEIEKVMAVREGRIAQVYPELFPSSGPWDSSIVANMIDVAARDLAEVLAPLPSFDCSPEKKSNDSAQRRAEKKSKIIQHHIDFSRLQTQSYDACDDYFTAGYVVGMVEVDVDESMPRIMFHSAQGFYPIFNRWREVTGGFFSFFKTRDELCAEYPHVASSLGYASGNAEFEVVRYHDKYTDLLFMPNAGTGKSMVLVSAKNMVGECLIEYGSRPGLRDKPRGQFADVVAVQVAKSRFALLGLEAATKSVQSQLIVPTDVVEVPYGPDALIRTDNPNGVQKLRQEVPASAFAQQQSLDQELMHGARYAPSRRGEVSGSIVTGAGVDALDGAFDTQIRTGQAMLAGMFKRLMQKSLMVEEKLFGDVTKNIKGNQLGAPYEITYTPSKDINGDYTVDVQYGLMAGLNPNQALVFGLQALQANIISEEFLMTQMPFSINPIEERIKIDVEQLRATLIEGMAGYVQSIPLLAQNGGDPSVPLLAAMKTIKARQAGKSIEDAVQEGMAPPEPTVSPGGELPGEAGAPGSGPPGGVPDGMQPTGLLDGVAPGQAGQTPGGRPSMQSLVAGLSASGKANLSGNVTQRSASR